MSSTTTTSAEIGPRRDGVATYLDDNQALTRRVEALVASSRPLSLAAGDVNVTSRGDIVTLSGTVPDYATLDALKETVEGMPGVSQVYYDVQVSPLVDQRTTDENIAFSLQRSLVDQPRVTVEVVNGIVTLRGEPSSSRELVERIASRTPGVRTVVNELTEPPPSTSLVQ